MDSSRWDTQTRFTLRASLPQLIDGHMHAAASSASTAGSAASAAESLPCSDTPLEVQLFYRYVQLPDPEAVVTQLRCLCEELGLSGRMRIASEGINGILCGKPEQLARYREAMRQPGSPLEGLEVQYKLSAAGDDGDPI